LVGSAVRDGQCFRRRLSPRVGLLRTSIPSSSAASFACLDDRRSHYSISEFLNSRSFVLCAEHLHGCRWHRFAVSGGKRTTNNHYRPCGRHPTVWDSRDVLRAMVRSRMDCNHSPSAAVRERQHLGSISVLRPTISLAVPSRQFFVQRLSVFRPTVSLDFRSPSLVLYHSAIRPTVAFPVRSCDFVSRRSVVRTTLAFLFDARFLRHSCRQPSVWNPHHGGRSVGTG